MVYQTSFALIDSMIDMLPYIGYVAMGAALVFLIISVFLIEKVSKPFAAVGVMLLAIGLFSFLSGNCVFYMAENEAVDSCYEGVIVGKEASYVSATDDVEYTITFESEYECQDEKKAIQREVVVSEDTFFMYGIGDTFSVYEAAASGSDITWDSFGSTVSWLIVGLFLAGIAAAALGLNLAFVAFLVALIDLGDKKAAKAIKALLVVAAVLAIVSGVFGVLATVMARY